MVMREGEFGNPYAHKDFSGQRTEARAHFCESVEERVSKETSTQPVLFTECFPFLAQVWRTDDQEVTGT